MVTSDAYLAAVYDPGSCGLSLPAWPREVDQDEPVLRFQGINVPPLVPSLAAIRKSMLKNEWRSVAFDKIVNSDTMIAYARRCFPPKARTRRLCQRRSM